MGDMTDYTIEQAEKATHIIKHKTTGEEREIYGAELMYNTEYNEDWEVIEDVW